MKRLLALSALSLGAGLLIYWFVVAVLRPSGMVWVPGGEFTMGTDDPQFSGHEGPAHSVRVYGCWMDETDVSNAQFRYFVKISGYLGKSDAFDKPVADFSIAYADQGEQDHDVLMKAVRAGKLEVFVERE